MKKLIKLIIGMAVITTCYNAPTFATEQEVKQAIIDDNEYVKKHLKGPADSYSNKGAMEFWSSGGLMQKIDPSGRPGEWEFFNIDVKHIHVTILVPGKVAMAHYYSEGSMNPKGSAVVNNYRTRVSQVFTKEAGKWKVRSSHWSPISSGAGTSQTVLIE